MTEWKKPGLGPATLFSVACECVGAGFVALSGVVMGRRLPLAIFGQVSAALAIAQMVGTLTDSGIGMSMAQEIVKNGTAKGAIPQVLYRWRLFLLLTVAFALITVSPHVVSSPGGSTTLRALVPSVFLFILSDLFCWVLKAHRKILFSGALKSMSGALLLGLSLWWIKGSFPLRGVYAAYAVTAIATSVVGYWLTKHAFSVPSTNDLHLADVKRALYPVFLLGGLVTMNMVLVRMDVVLTQRWSGDEAAGGLAAVSRLLDGVRMLAASAYSILLPALAALHHDLSLLQSRFMSSYRNLLFAAITIALIGTVLSPTLFHVIYRRADIDIIHCFRIMIWDAVLIAANTVMFAKLYVDKDLLTPGYGLAVALFVNYFMLKHGLPAWGLTGAAWARLAADTSHFLCQTWGLVRNQRSLAKSLAIMPVACVGAAVIPIMTLSPYSALGGPVLSGLILGVIYWSTQSTVRSLSVESVSC